MGGTSGATLHRAVGAPALTMLIERGETRHVVAEAALIGTALWLAGKYIDGFLGDPVEDLGRKHREALTAAAWAVRARVGPGEDPSEEEVHTASKILTNAMVQCLADGVAFDSEAGREAVALKLQEAGVPRRAAERSAADLEGALKALAPDA